MNEEARNDFVIRTGMAIDAAVSEFLDDCDSLEIVPGYMEGDRLYIDAGVLAAMVSSFHTAMSSLTSVSEENSAAVYGSAAMGRSINALIDTLFQRLAEITPEDIIQ